MTDGHRGPPDPLLDYQAEAERLAPPARVRGSVEALQGYVAQREPSARITGAPSSSSEDKGTGAGAQPRAGVTRAIAGLSAGCLSTLALHPFDLIKTRYQATDLHGKQGAFSYRTITNAVATIVREEGLRNGLYRGALPAVVGSSLSWGIYFESYQRAKMLVALLGQRVKSEYLSQRGSINHLISGTIAGIITVLLTNPIWLLKTRMQLERGSKDNFKGAELSQNQGGVFSTMQSVWRDEGLRGFYRGIGPSMFLVTHGAIQFAVYEKIRLSLLRRRFMAKLSRSEELENELERSLDSISLRNSAGQAERLSVIESLIAATASKVIASLVTYPLQVARTRMQQRGADPVAYGSMIRALRTIYMRNSFRGLYRGIVANLLRVAPSSAITFMCYEQISQLLDRL